MNGKKSLCVALLSFAYCSGLWAQNPVEHIKWTGGVGKNETPFSQYYNAWQPGQPLMPDLREDENFFISRVRLRERFTHQATQVDYQITPENDKRILNWVPSGKANDGRPGALPSGYYDSDVFSMWNYITHYGNWIAPLVRMPAAFTDAAHKNGVSVSVLASVPNEGLPASHKRNFDAMIAKGAPAFVKLLKQYGIDGWGVNSEFSTTFGFANELQTFMANVYEEAVTNAKLPSYAMVWYTGISNYGGISFVDGLTNSQSNWFQKNGKPGINYLFGNYNWGTSTFETNERLAKSMNRDTRDIYGGIDQQNGERRINWPLYKRYATSIGLWGAHNMNMFFESRGEQGSQPEVQQSTYLNRLERFFTNGLQNPAKKLEVIERKHVYGLDALLDFHGMSAFATAKSVLKWNLDEAPFYSFFNLGNGKFFNDRGETIRDAEWYNLGMQDYLPTWRYWFATELLGSGDKVAENGLKATFTWNDAWFGGSSLKISGTTEQEYLHLFKTKFELKDGDKITIRYKLLSGTGIASLVGVAEGSENDEENVELFDSEEGVERDEWLEKTISVSNTGKGNLALAGRTLALLALKFEEASDLNLLVGEVSIKRADVQLPEVPSVINELTSVKKRSFKGVDIKVNFQMSTPAGHNSEEPVYNDEVKTAFYKVYIKQGNDTPKFMTATTSWAAMIYNAPYKSDAGDLLVGVSAVGLDGVTESEIAWSNVLPMVGYTSSDVLKIDKTVIKPNQDFTISYQDDQHPEVKWEILNSSGEVVKSANGKLIKTQLAELGIYDLRITPADGTPKLYSGYVQVSGLAIGAVPEITKLTFNANEEVNNQKMEIKQKGSLSYTSKNSDGRGSRGLNLEEKPVGVALADIGLKSMNSEFTFAFWIKVNTVGNKPLNLFNIRNVSWDWPYSNWGQIWAPYWPEHKGGSQEVTRREDFRPGTPENKQLYQYSLTPGAWMHLTYVFKKASSGGTVSRLYINGKELKALEHQPGGGRVWIPGEDVAGMNVTDTRYNDAYMYVGGATRDWAGVDGVVDDVKYFDKALSSEEVAAQMVSNDRSAPGLKGYWDFETDLEVNEDGSPKGFPNLATDGNKNAYLLYGKQIAIEGEGRTKIVADFAKWEAGSPLIDGTSFLVKTKPTWSFKKATVEGADTYTPTEGSATISYKKAGTFSGKLTLENSWGKDERTIEGIVISDPQSVGDITDEVSLAAFPNPFVESVNVRFAAAGDYQIGIYDLSGRLVSQQVVSAEAGSIISVNLNAPAGLYLLRVQTTAGKLLQTIKLQKN